MSNNNNIFDSLIGGDLKSYLEYSNGKLLYVGVTKPGTTTDKPLWAIKKLVYDGDNVIQILWADGCSKFLKVWDNRGDYIYS